MEEQDQLLLDKFTDDDNEPPLFLGWLAYALVADKLPIEAQAFLISIIIDFAVPLLEQILSSFHKAAIRVPISREERKRRLSNIIESMRNMPEFADASWTDKQPLIVGAR
jgi:hypothetical protein